MQLDKEPATMVREPDATLPPPQDQQLMSTRRILRCKSQPRLERRGQDGQPRNREARSSRQLRRFHHIINSAPCGATSKPRLRLGIPAWWRSRGSSLTTRSRSPSGWASFERPAGCSHPDLDCLAKVLARLRLRPTRRVCRLKRPVRSRRSEAEPVYCAAHSYWLSILATRQYDGQQTGRLQ